MNDIDAELRINLALKHGVKKGKIWAFSKVFDLICSKKQIKDTEILKYIEEEMKKVKVWIIKDKVE